MPKMPISDFRQLDETNRSLIVWQGLTDSWTKLTEITEKVGDVETDTKILKKLILTGDGEPSIMERVRNLEKFEDKFEYWTKFVGGALLLNFIGFSVGIAIALIRFLPVLEELAKKP